MKTQASGRGIPENPYSSISICENVHPPVAVIIGGDHPFLHLGQLGFVFRCISVLDFTWPALVDESELAVTMAVKYQQVVQPVKVQIDGTKLAGIQSTGPGVL